MPRLAWLLTAGVVGASERVEKFKYSIDLYPHVEIGRAEVSSTQPTYRTAVVIGADGDVVESSTESFYADSSFTRSLAVKHIPSATLASGRRKKDLPPITRSTVAIFCEEAVPAPQHWKFGEKYAFRRQGYKLEPLGRRKEQRRWYFKVAYLSHKLKLVECESSDNIRIASFPTIIVEQKADKVECRLDRGLLNGFLSGWARKVGWRWFNNKSLRWPSQSHLLEGIAVKTAEGVTGDVLTVIVVYDENNFHRGAAIAGSVRYGTIDSESWVQWMKLVAQMLRPDILLPKVDEDRPFRIEDVQAFSETLYKKWWRRRA